MKENKERGKDGEGKKRVRKERESEGKGVSEGVRGGSEEESLKCSDGKGRK